MVQCRSIRSILLFTTLVFLGTGISSSPLGSSSNAADGSSSSSRAGGPAMWASTTQTPYGSFQALIATMQEQGELSQPVQGSIVVYWAKVDAAAWLGLLLRRWTTPAAVLDILKSHRTGTISHGPPKDCFVHTGVVIELVSHRVVLGMEVYQSGLYVSTYASAHEAVRDMEARGGKSLKVGWVSTIEGMTGYEVLSRLKSSVANVMTWPGYDAMSHNCQDFAVLCGRR